MSECVIHQSPPKKRSKTLFKKRKAKSGEARAFAERAATWKDDGDCVEWPFGTNRLGYGRLLFDGQIISASTAVCEMAHGPKPADKDVAAHRCGNRLCVNPHHLYWATNSENHGRDRLKHGTSNRGERNGQQKITESQVREIRARPEASRSHARRLGICWAQYLRIRRGERWKWVK